MTWRTNLIGDCDCKPTPMWRILKDENQVYPWRVFRRTSDGGLEELMGCATRAAAAQLVESFDWMRRNGLRWRKNNV